MCARLKPLISLTTLPFIPLSLSCFLLHSRGGVPEKRTAQTFFGFFGGDQQLVSNWLQPVSDENGFLNSSNEAIWGQRHCHIPLQPRNIQGSMSDGLGEMDQEGQEQERNKQTKKTLFADLSTCVIFTSLIKTHFPSISKSERSLLEMTSARLSCGQSHALFMRRLL